jgi:2-keto-4-pentenoate hydratase/2-oxohepta-3-ene-1,7-dioic acid hydratase in catechol pathway
MPLPAEPIIFFKSTTALAGPHDSVVIPRSSSKTDWEVELAVVIGKKAQYGDGAE